MSRYAVIPPEVRMQHKHEIRKLVGQLRADLKCDFIVVSFIDNGHSSDRPQFFSIDPQFWDNKQGYLASILEVTTGLSGLAVEEDRLVRFPSGKREDAAYLNVNRTISAEMVAPLHYDDACAGVVLCDTGESGRAFTDADALVLRNFTARLDSLFAAHQQVKAQLKDLAQRCLDRTESLRGYIAVKNFDGKLDYVKVGTDTDIFLELSATEGLCGEVFQKGESVCSGNVLLHSEYVPSDSEIQSECIYPIKKDGLTVAIVNMESQALDFYSREREQIIKETAKEAEKLVVLSRRYPSLTYFYGLWDLLESMIYILNNSSKERGEDDGSIRSLMIARLCHAAGHVTQSSECIFWDRRQGLTLLPPLLKGLGIEGTETLGKIVPHPTCENKRVVYEPLLLDGEPLGLLAVAIEEYQVSTCAPELRRLLEVVSTSFKRRKFQNQHQLFLDCISHLNSNDASWTEITETIHSIPKIIDCTHCTFFYRPDLKEDCFIFGPSTSNSPYYDPSYADPFYSSTQDIGLIPYALRKKRTVRILQVWDQAELHDLEPNLKHDHRILEHPDPKYRSVILVPVFSEETVVGIIRAYRNKDSRRSGFTTREAQLIEALASGIGIIMGKSFATENVI